MPYAGKQLMQREVTEYASAYWPQRKVEATAVVLGESHCYVGAWHDNLDDAGNVTSRDCGLAQINIAPRYIGTDYENALRTESKDAEEYVPVVKANLSAALSLYNDAWPTHASGKREWQPWVAYTSGWALHPRWYVWHRDATGEPVGPWVASGRYVQQAIRAVANWHVYIAKDMTPTKALNEAARLAAIYGVTDGVLAYDATHGVYWKPPAAPTTAPADPYGPEAYAQQNDGESYLTKWVRDH